MPADDLVMVGSYNHHLVVLSILISIVAAYAARGLSIRIRDARGWVWLVWLGSGATADGIGTWSMHYTGMLAYSLPVGVEYDWPTVLLSLLAGILGAGAAKLVLSHTRIGWPEAWIAAIFMGVVGISTMHYVAMAAMRLQGMHHYDATLVTISVGLAIVFSLMALALDFVLPESISYRRLRYHGSAVLRGAANPVMHYTAMAAVSFTSSAVAPDLSHSVNISSLGIAGNIVVPVMVLVVALLTSLVDRLRKQGALLNELFEQAPQAVVLMTVDNQVLRVNREFTRVFGYSPQAALGRHLSDLIVPDESRDEDQRYTDLVARGQRVDVEGVRRRKDGSRLHVSIIQVPVSIPDGQVEVYAIYRDITQRKRAEEELREYAGRLQVLSRRVVEVQEEERRHLALELHDEIGQILTAISVNLQALKDICDAAALPRLDDSINLVKGAIGQVRNLALDLRPSMLDDLGLISTLRWNADRQAERSGLVVHFAAESSGARLPTNLETACYRIVQEALTNVVRHAKARQVWLEYREQGQEVQLLIRDDGVGFDLSAVRDRAVRGASFGVLGMQERVELLDGHIDIESKPMHGTTIRVRFPFTPASSDATE